MIRWEVGRSIFDCIGNKATTFMKYTDEGSAFVYGDDLVKKVPIFAFEVRPKFDVPPRVRPSTDLVAFFRP